MIARHACELVVVIVVNVGGKACQVSWGSQRHPKSPQRAKSPQSIPLRVKPEDSQGGWHCKNQ